MHVAHQVADLFPDGRLYVDIRGAAPTFAPVTPGCTLARLIRAMGVADVPAETCEAAARTGGC